MSLYNSPLYTTVLFLTVLACVVCNIGLAIDQLGLYLPSLVFASVLVLIDVQSRHFCAPSHSFRCWALVLETSLWGLTSALAAAAWYSASNGLVTCVTVLYGVRSVIRVYYLSNELIKRSHPNRTIEELSIVLPQVQIEINTEEDDKPDDSFRNSVQTAADEYDI